MNNERPIKVNYAVLCDDSRREDNGKVILIRVYGANILLPAFPINIVLALAVFSETKEIGPIRCEFRITQGLRRSELGKTTITFDQLGRTIFVIKPIPLVVLAPGPIEFLFRQRDAEWEKIAEMPAILRPST
jgi:hypothetical protein